MKKFNQYFEDADEMKRFIQTNGLDGMWKDYQKDRNKATVPAATPKGWKVEKDEIARNINIAAREALGTNTRVNNFGIDSIKFEANSSGESEKGVELTLEAQGTTVARDRTHIISQLRQYMARLQKLLREKRIRVLPLYNRLDVSEAVNENDYPAVGLTKKFKFSLLCKVVALTN